MSNQTIAAPEVKKESRAAQIILSLLIFAGFAAFLFIPDSVFSDAGLFRSIIDFFKNMKLAEKYVQIAYLSYTAFYAILLICTVVSLFVRNKAAFALNCFKTLVGITVTVFYMYVLIRNGLGLIGVSDIFRDDKTFIALNSTVLSLIFGMIMAIVLSISFYKGKGVAKTFSAIIALAFAAFLFYEKPFIGTFRLVDLFDTKLTYGTGFAGKLASYSFMALAFASAANLALALLALAVRKMGVCDLIRSIAMFIIASLCLGLLIADAGIKNLFDYQGTVGFFAISFVQFIYTVIVFAAGVASAKKKKPGYEFDANNQMAFQGYAQPQAAEASEAAYAAPAPSEPVSEEAARTNAAFDEAAQISIDDIVEEAAKQEADKYDDAIRDVPDEEAGKETEEEKPFDFNQAKHDGTFNRDYSDYQAEQEAARAQEAAYAREAARQEAARAAQQQAAPQQPYGNAPYYGAYGAGYAAQYAQTAPGYFGGPIPYLPDAFINSLTPAERDEFDKLFISRVYGENKRLPVYTVGADNREFFTKIFVFMGRYRSIISEGLLEKIYNYSNSLR